MAKGMITPSYPKPIFLAMAVSLGNACLISGADMAGQHAGRSRNPAFKGFFLFDPAQESEGPQHLKISGDGAVAIAPDEPVRGAFPQPCHLFGGIPQEPLLKVRVQSRIGIDQQRGQVILDRAGSRSLKVDEIVSAVYES